MRSRGRLLRMGTNGLMSYDLSFGNRARNLKAERCTNCVCVIVTKVPDRNSLWEQLDFGSGFQRSPEARQGSRDTVHMAYQEAKRAGWSQGTSKGRLLGPTSNSQTPSSKSSIHRRISLQAQKRECSKCRLVGGILGNNQLAVVQLTERGAQNDSSA